MKSDTNKDSSTRIRIFFNPQLFLSGYGFRRDVCGESGIRISNFFESALKNEKFWIRYESGILWTLNQDIF